MLKSLVDSGLLLETNYTLTKRRSQRYLDKTSVDSLINDLKNKVKLDFPLDEPKLDLWKSAKKINRTVAEIIKLVLDSELTLVSNGKEQNRGLKNFFLLETDLQEFIQKAGTKKVETRIEECFY